MLCLGNVCFIFTVLTEQNKNLLGACVQIFMDHLKFKLLCLKRIFILTLVFAPSQNGELKLSA